MREKRDYYTGIIIAWLSIWGGGGETGWRAREKSHSIFVAASFNAEIIAREYSHTLTLVITNDYNYC